MQFVLDIAGDKQIARDLLRFGDRAVNAAPAFERIADYWMAETALQFESEGAHASGGWAPLKLATIARKQAAGLDERILHGTGALEKSLTVRGDGNQLLEITEDELLFGSRLPYAEVHQNPKATNPLPRRRPIEFLEGARRHTVKLLQEHIVGEKQ